MRNLKKGTTALLTLTVVGAGMLANAGIVAAQDDELIVGVSWNNFQEERWARDDEPAIKAALEAAGAYVHLDRRSIRCRAAAG